MTTNRKPPTKARTAAKVEEASRTADGGLDKLVSELKSNRELFFKLSTDPQSVARDIEYLDDNERALVSVVNPKDLVSIDFRRPGDLAACGGSCGASCGGSCGGSCGASCGGSCGGSCGASCAGSCVASCAASCVASCVASGALPVVDDWYTNPIKEVAIDDAQALMPVVQAEIREFSAFMR